MTKILLKYLTLAIVITQCVVACNKETPANPDEKPQEKPVETVDNSIKILAIGNSFSVDAMEYLYGVLKDLGYDEIVLGNLYIGGCTLETHASNFKNNSASYTYYLNTDGTWSNTASYKPYNALSSEQWDIITMQQGSPKSGLPESYDTHLKSLVSIVNSVQTKVVPSGYFSKVIPNGTAVQNMRTSFVGDNLTRDGYHMSYDIGRYLTALGYAKALTGRDLDKVTYTPSGYTFSKNAILAMKDAVNKACATPYAVTASAYPPDPEFDLNAATPAEIAQHNGYDLTEYTAMQIDFTDFAFYNSGSAMKSTMHTLDNYAWNSTISAYITTPIYTKSDLPNGTLIVQRGGNMYRPEGWTSLDVQNGSRPGNVTSNLVVVSDSWWGKWEYRAFNVAYSDKRALAASNPRNNPDQTTLCEDLKKGFAIYLPKK